MKKNINFKIKSFLWPSVILTLLILGAIWTNAGYVQYQPSLSLPNNPLQSPDTKALLPNNPSAEAPSNHSPTTALMVQEGISQVISVVRPAVVSVSRISINSPPIPVSGLTYLDPYPTDTGPMGSGIIVHSKGFVVTTFQTVGKDKTVKITLFSGGNRKYKADVIGIDPNTDLALLKIQSNEVFPAAVLGNSDLLETGDIVFAIGSPFGFSRTVTMGIISSKTRRLNINGIKYPEMIQTDATVNEGNDGGPLVNIKGEIIGINMACFMPDNQFSGISFAIPINNILAFIQTCIGV